MNRCFVFISDPKSIFVITDDLTEHEGIQDGDKWDIHQQEPL